MGAYPVQHALEREHPVVGYPCVVPFDGRQEMQVRPLFQLFLDLTGRKALVRNDDPFPDVIVPDEGRVGACVDAVSGKDLGAHRLHELYVIGVQDGDLAAPPCPCLV